MSAHNYIRSDSRKYRANCAACVCVFERIILSRDHTRREGQVARGETAVVVAAQSPPRFCLTAKRTHTHHMYGENGVYASERSLAEWGQGEDMCWAPLLVSFSLSRSGCRSWVVFVVLSSCPPRAQTYNPKHEPHRSDRSDDDVWILNAIVSLCVASPQRHWVALGRFVVRTPPRARTNVICAKCRNALYICTNTHAHT